MSGSSNAWISQLLSDQHRFYRRHEGDIKRIVVDECHQILTSVEYRHQFSALKELANFPVQKIYLTATLPPNLEYELKVATSLPGTTTVIRESTDRPNLGYHVLHCQEFVADTNQVVVELAKLIEGGFDTDSRGIIFCRSVSRVELVAEKFGGCRSHAGMEEKDRLQAFDNWLSGSAKWMVATTGFLHGIDYGWVDGIIFLELPYGLMNLVQGAGRAGRKGRPAHVFLLHSSNQAYLMGLDSDPDRICYVEGVGYLKNTTECRRSIITRVMDGVGVGCRDVFNALLCDICEPESQMATASKALVVEKRRGHQSFSSFNSSSLYNSSSLLTPGGQMKLQESAPSSSSQNTGSLHYRSTMSSSGGHTPASEKVATTSLPAARMENIGKGPASMSILMDTHYAKNQTVTLVAKVEIISRVTEMLKGHCAVCWAWKKKLTATTGEHTPFIDCSGETVKYKYGWIDFKRLIRKSLGKYVYCYNCGLPQGKLLPTSHPSFKQGAGVRCPLNDFAFLVLWHIYHHEETWEEACMKFPEVGWITKVEEFKGWVTQSQGGDRFWNGLELVIWFMCEREKGLI